MTLYVNKFNILQHQMLAIQEDNFHRVEDNIWNAKG